MDFNSTMLTNFAKDVETLTPFGSLFVIFLLSLVINYRLFKGRMEDCAKDKEKMLEKLDSFKEILDELKLEIRSLKK